MIVVDLMVQFCLRILVTQNSNLFFCVSVEIYMIQLRNIPG